MKEKIKKYIKEGFVFIVLLTVASNVISYYRAMDLNKEKLDIKSFELLDGTTYHVSGNRPLLVHFWATWCPTCKFEAPNIEKISKDYDVITIAVQSGTNNNIQHYLKEHHLSFRVVNDQEGFYSRKFNIKAFPTTIIYDKNKEQMFSEVGYTTTAGLYSRMALSQ